MTTFTCNLCEAMCGLRVTVEGRDVRRVEGDPDDVVSRGHVCPKAHGLAELYADPDRLRAPRRRDGARVGWTEALDEIAARFRAIQRAHGRDAVAIYVGNPAVHAHRTALASQLLTAALGSRNRYDPNSQDSNPRLFACMQVYGDALSIPVPDLDRTDYLLMLGANPAVSNGSQMVLGDAKARFAAMRARGATIVLIDPRRTESAAWSTRHHFIRPGGDAALLLAILHVLFAERLDRATRVTGLDELRAAAAPFSPARVGPAIGVDAAAIVTIARELAAAPRACIYARVGVCQNEFGPTASWLVEALNLVTGNVDRPGGVMWPTPAADVAPLGRLVIGNHAGRWRSRVRGLPEFLGSLPSAALAEEIETPGPGRIRGLLTIAGNPVLTVPNGPRLERALGSLDYMASIDLYVNETTRHADVVLPARHVFETGNFDLILGRFGVRNFAKYSPPIVLRTADAVLRAPAKPGLAIVLRTADAVLRAPAKPGLAIVLRTADAVLRAPAKPGLAIVLRTADAVLRAPAKPGLAIIESGDDTRDDWAIATALAARLRGVRFLGGLGRGLPERVVDLLLRTGPYRLSLAKLRAAPHGLDLGPLVPRWNACVRTPDRLARLAPTSLLADVPRVAAWLDAPRPGLALIGRRDLRSNNSWMHNLRALAKGPDRARLRIHPTDATARGLIDGARVRIRSRAGEVVALVTVTDEVMPGVVSLPHGFGHQAATTLTLARALPGASANVLTDELTVEPVIGTSILNGVPVEVTPAEIGGYISPRTPNAGRNGSWVIA